MSSDWRGLALGALGEFRNGVNFSREQEGHGLPVLKVKDFASSYFVPSEGLDELDSRAIRVPASQMLAPGDVVVIRSNGNPSLVGRCLYVAKLQRPTTFSGFCIRFRPNPERVNPRFASYLLRSPASRARFYSFGSGTGIQNLSQSVLSELPVLLPPRRDQDSITDLLAGLDDKIDLNRRMNRTLEAMAQALFRSWFVDFDPVRAKAEGRQPEGMDAETAALFPSRLVHSELGEIPEGWIVRPVGDVVSVCGGSTPSTSEPSYWEGGSINWTTPKDLSRLEASILLKSERQITERGLATISSGLLPSGTVLLSSRAPIGYVALTEIPTAVNQGFIAMRCEGVLPNYYMLNWTLRNVERIKERANGSTFMEISKSNFRPLPVVVPQAEVLRGFVQVVGPLYRRVTTNLRESQALADLRDLLLPKLLSGEVRVRDAEAHLAASA